MSLFCLLSNKRSIIIHKKCFESDSWVIRYYTALHGNIKGTIENGSLYENMQWLRHNNKTIEFVSTIQSFLSPSWFEPLHQVIHEILSCHFLLGTGQLVRAQVFGGNLAWELTNGTEMAMVRWNERARKKWIAQLCRRCCTLRNIGKNCQTRTWPVDTTHE